MRGKSLVVFLALVVPLLLPLVSGCSPRNQPTEEAVTAGPATLPGTPARGFYMGVLPTPAEGQSFADAYAQTAEYAEFVPVWGKPSPFYRMADDLAGDWGRVFIKGYIYGNGMYPLVHLSFMGAGLTLATPPGMEGATLSDGAWRAAYKQAALDVVRVVQPCYLSLGNEVNRWYEAYGVDKSNPNGFQHYVSLYEEIYDAVKAASPQTKVFCTFAREIVSEHREADLKVLQLFNPDKMDLLVWTSYPYAVRGIKRPSDIPDNYYSQVSAYMPGKPLGFSELGWSSLEALGGEQGQADFLTQVAGRLTRGRGVELRLLMWAWLHDIDNNDTIGLIKRDGTEKLAYQVWKELSTSGK